MADFWTDDRTETLKVKKAEGYSAREIAYRIGDGCTRNMVIGKLHRLGIQTQVVRYDWTPERIATLKRMYADSKSFEEISAAIGVGIASVRQKASRLGLASRGHVHYIVRSKATKTQYRPRIVNTIPAPSTEAAVGLLDMTGCKWPVTPDDCPKDAHRFCNHATEGNSPYCVYHAEMNRAKPEKKQGYFVIRQRAA